jgi:hypothetical protein
MSLHLKNTKYDARSSIVVLTHNNNMPRNKEQMQEKKKKKTRLNLKEESQLLDCSKLDQE